MWWAVAGYLVSAAVAGDADVALRVQPNVPCVDAPSLQRALKTRGVSVRETVLTLDVRRDGELLAVKLLGTDQQILASRRLPAAANDCALLPGTIAALTRSWLDELSAGTQPRAARERVDAGAALRTDENVARLLPATDGGVEPSLTRAAGSRDGGARSPLGRIATLNPDGGARSPPDRIATLNPDDGARSPLDRVAALNPDGGANSPLDRVAALNADGGATSPLDRVAALNTDGGATSPLDRVAALNADGAATSPLERAALSPDGGAPSPLDRVAVIKPDAGATSLIDRIAAGGVDGAASISLDGGAVSIRDADRTDAGLAEPTLTDAGTPDRWQDHQGLVALLAGGIRFGPRDAVVASGAFTAEWGFYEPFGLALDLGLDSPRTATVSPGQASASVQWGSLLARVHLIGPRRAGLTLSLGAGADRIAASATGFTATGSAELYAPSISARLEWRQPLWRGLQLFGRVGIHSRFRDEHFQIDNLGTVLTLPPLAFETAIGLGWRFF